MGYQESEPHTAEAMSKLPSLLTIYVMAFRH